MTTELDNIATALETISADDRDDWVMCAMAVKSALGDDGFEVWDNWSRRSDKYNAGAARSVWKSVKPSGGVTIASLYWLARQYGWKPGDAPPAVLRGRTRGHARREEMRVQEAERAKRQREAVARARAMLARAEQRTHPYLARKGFPHQLGLVDPETELLLVPMFQKRRTLAGLQTIGVDGTKLFLRGQRSKGAMYVMGTHKWNHEWYFCEGYATGLSIRAALDELHVRDNNVAVCFSANSMANAAVESKARSRYIVADNDTSGVGEKYADSTGLSWWMPPMVGDANDYHQFAGLRALAQAILELRRSETQITEDDLSSSAASTDNRTSAK